MTDSRHTLTDPAQLAAPRGPVDAAVSTSRDLETVMALATHQLAALAADVQAAVEEAMARLDAAVRDAEQRLQQATR